MMSSPVLCATCLWLSAAGALSDAREAHAAPPRLALQAVIQQGLNQPLYLTHASDGTGRLYIVEQGGTVRLLDDGKLTAQPFLDISERVLSGSERGLLGLAFHPDFPNNERLFVNYTRKPDGATVVSEFRVTDGMADQDSEQVLLTVAQPYANHNGGMLSFGPDGFLYIGLGDGGFAGDPGNRAQAKDSLLGKLLRIDVSHGAPYAIPADNPFVKGGGRAEIYAYGFRNPWRFSFDRETGELWLADVGQNGWEEINVVERGKNYGWRVMEGNHCFLPPLGCNRAGLAPPRAEYRNKSPRCSITGGYVYRGQTVPALTGVYVFGDYCSGEVMALRGDKPEVLTSSKLRIASLGEDEQGEIYVIDHQGGVYRITQPD